MVRVSPPATFSTSFPGDVTVLPSAHGVGGKGALGLSQRAQTRGLMEQPQPRGRGHLSCNQGASFSGCKPPLPTVLPRPGFLGVFYPLFNCLGLPSMPASVPTLLWHTPSLFSWVSVSKIKRQSGCQSIPLALPGPESRSVSIHAVGVINLVLRMQPVPECLRESHYHHLLALQNLWGCSWSLPSLQTCANCCGNHLESVSILTPKCHD